MNPETATSIRYQQAQSEVVRDRLECCPDQQWEAIARHYVAHAHLAKYILHLINMRRGYDYPSPAFDRTIQMHVDTIKANHLKDFGIELEWPKQDYKQKHEPQPYLSPKAAQLLGVPPNECCGD